MKSVKKYLVLAVLTLLIACSKDDPVPIKSNAKQMISFRFVGIDKDGITVDIPGIIDDQNKTVIVVMPSRGHGDRRSSRNSLY